MESGMSKGSEGNILYFGSDGSGVSGGCGGPCGSVCVEGVVDLGHDEVVYSAAMWTGFCF